MNEPNRLLDAAAIAQFRFDLIAPLSQDLFPDATKTAYYKRVTENPLKLPDGTAKEYDYKTVETWVSQYRHGGIDTLMPRGRFRQREFQSSSRHRHRRNLPAERRVPTAKCHTDPSETDF